MAYQYVTGQKLNEQEWPNQQQIIAGYQYLRAHKKADVFLDQEGMAAFISRSSLAAENE